MDIFYGGRYVGAVMATYAPGEIEFQNPAAVAALIPNLLDRKRIRQNLTGTLSSNAYLVCRNQYSEDCGTVEPAISAVVFDESRFRVDVFVAETELSVQEVAVDKYLPPAETGFSFIHALSAVYSSLERSDDNYSINGNTLLSHKESRIRMFSNISKDDDLNIDVLAYERDFEGRSYQVGLLQTNNQNAVFLPTLQITGARFASSLDTRNDLDFSEGSPLNVFLASRSRVEIFKDDRLVTSGIYEAGNQSLDTRALPGGAYDITIKVVRAGAVLREEQRFYRKSSQIPPEDQDLFFIEGGRLMENFNEGTFPESADNFLFRGGYSSRVSDGFGLNGSVAVAQNG